MRTYTLKKITGTPDWENIAILPIDTLMWTEATDIRAQAQLCWDDEAIHVRLKADETEIRAEHTGLLASVCEDSCLEFFFGPVDGDSRYFNFEFNPNCALYLGYGRNMDELIRLVVQDQDETFAPRVQRSQTGWEITYRVPFAFIRKFFPEFTPTENLPFRGNCYKCGDLTPKLHFLSWNPIESGRTFHCPQYFGRMIFGGADA